MTGDANKWIVWIGFAILFFGVLFQSGVLRRRAWREEGFVTANDVLKEWLQHVANQQKQLGDGSPEVFQVGPDKFTYEMAKERCVRYGGRLATAEELHAAKEKGAHWCRKGWIDGGKVAFVKGARDNELLGEECPKGEPGVYTETFPHAVRFAATCYAPRPKPGIHWQEEVERRRKAMDMERVRREAEASVRFVASLRQQMEADQRVREDMMQDDVAPFNGKDLIWSASS